jgi:hypothetical protein
MLVNLEPETIKAATDNPVTFVRTVFNVRPNPWQASVLSRLWDRGITREAIKSCRRAGKTALLAWIVILWMLRKEGARCLCTAPTEHQLRDLLWPECHTWIKRGGLEAVLLWSKTIIRHVADPIGWYAAARVGRIHKEGIAGETGGEAFGLQGLHSPHMLVVADEASGIPNPAYVAIEGSLSGGDPKLIAAGNPNVPSGWFFEAFNRDTANWHTTSVGYLDAPMVDNAWAENMIQRFGKRNPVVRVHVLGMFPTGVKGGLIPLWAWEEAQQPERRADLAATQENDRRVLGLDVAREGSNRTVLAYAEGAVIHKLELIDEYKAPKIARAVQARFMEFEPDFVVVDSDGGYGAGVVDSLEEMRVPGVVAWRGSAAATDSKHFTNARAELAWSVKLALEEGRLSVPGPDADSWGSSWSLEAMCQAQATGVKYHHMPDGRICIESKKEMEKRGLESPDEFDACCYAMVPILLAPSIGSGAFLPSQPRARDGMTVNTNRGRHGIRRGQVSRSMLMGQ